MFPLNTLAIERNIYVLGLLPMAGELRQPVICALQ